MAFHQQGDVLLRRGNVESREDIGKTDTLGDFEKAYENEDKQQEYKIQCDEINKRSIGKAIVKFCGNEGTVNDKNKEMLRRLLQATISHIEEEPLNTWKNAEVKIYDDNFDMYSIKAGKGQNMFMVSLDENDEPKVIRTKPSRVNSNIKNDKRCLLM
ncbi:uncharacterized protein LOC128557668 [Mercenaria mercenaria]|uniref:uncharacterized protein LOC128557668 n=1 Tax=Mercenaria mercenaria TaxID=6596 RepID=UPI00234F0103|nr:uncharacterized protein LOC128557668 [Mercenaria mercenaria]